MISEAYAREYNAEPAVAANSRANKIAFLTSRVLELPRGLANLEPLLRGDYTKHSDNTGKICSARDVPQAFSHYTYHRSRGALVVVDLQGVGDFFTDPQIHGRDGRGFGLGNLGARGISDFRATHRCNAVCRALRLPRP